MTLQVFKEVPDHDPRTLVLKKDEELLDLQFCSCPNKYKKRFSQLLQEHPEIVDWVKSKAVAIAEQGYKEFDVKNILEAIRTEAKCVTPISEYLAKYPHDFQLEVLYRSFLVRKLMMEEEKLFGFFALSPIKCRANCGYPEDATPKEEEATSLAGF